MYVHRVMLCYFMDKYKVFSDCAEEQAKYKNFIAEYEKITM
ncbi:unnamed protein product [Toxocara canis]|uniref:Uncharacterized protein n=1 Tax=Toxocara canis TaxID=6265 RepID=A0A3P7HFH0_TOXCA|nr:unnamed protein product [Toxocara canis]